MSTCLCAAKQKERTIVSRLHACRRDQGKTRYVGHAAEMSYRHETPRDLALALVIARFLPGVRPPYVVLVALASFGDWLAR